MKKTVKILSSLVGIVFLISGIGKSLVTFNFSQILVQYGFEFFQYFAPVIIVIEIFLGLSLFFCIKLRLTSLISFIFVSILSLAYLYGYFFANISNCGCFGHFSFLNTPPLFTFLRNIVLLGLLLLIYLKSKDLHKIPDKNEIRIITAILCAVCFVAGYTFVKPQSDATQYVTKGKNINIDVNQSVLGEFHTFSKDSSYFVFAFSYSCPHCFSSIENLKQYERLGVADKSLALSFSPDGATPEIFNALFMPNFQIKHFPPLQLFRLTNRFPVSYYIKNNIITMEIHGLLPCGYLLRFELEEK